MADRKAFNFYKSYYDVFKELSNKDKLDFIEALLDRQFTGKEPNNLTGLAKFAYISQKTNIDSQVKGWEDKTGCKLNSSTPIEPPKQGDIFTPTEPPSLQEEGKGQEKGQEKEYFSFDDFWKIYPKKVQKKDCERRFNNLKESDKKKIKDTIHYFLSYKPFPSYNHPNPSVYLNQERWNDEISLRFERDIDADMKNFDTMSEKEKQEVINFIVTQEPKDITQRQNNFIYLKGYDNNGKKVC